VPARPDKEYYDPLTKFDPVVQEQNARTGRRKKASAAETIEISASSSYDAAEEQEGEETSDSGVEEPKGGN
jgi:hypothetical protein